MENRFRAPQNRNLPAAVTQCFSVVALCTAVADPNWFQVALNGTSPQIYGVAYVVRLQGNLTADPNTVLNYEGISLLIVMATCSYFGILTGFGAFILSFLGSRHPLLFNLPITLHFITATLDVVSLALCSYLFFQVKTKLRRKEFQKIAMQATLGESFVIAVFGVMFSVTASALSLHKSLLKDPRVLGSRTEEEPTLVTHEHCQDND
ncbi:transmembrane protein 127 isoform X2 [Rhincodon typus]|uniref:transmembrane protein 127 isoform X2 n=1 Tax=Rhincodon typus TaxID=259920 RepID=UPI0009A45014|nr:transmembrane protein 127 isoform X2 [Rhincodon typus]